MKAYKIPPSQDYVILDEIQKTFVANSQGSRKQQGLQKSDVCSLSSNFKEAVSRTLNL